MSALIEHCLCRGDSSGSSSSGGLLKNRRMVMSRGDPRNLPKGITPKTRTKNGKVVPVLTADGTPVYRVRVWDAVLKRQIERTAEGLEAAKTILSQFNEAQRRPGRLDAERVRFVDVASRYL